MSDTAFTPGPWRYEETVCVKTGDDDLVALIYSTIKPSENGGESNLVANANLIAAAPDMFETLEFAAKALREAEFVESAIICERAIAKARGASA